jgi:aminodeoxyfutalosine deaminase
VGATLHTAPVVLSLADPPLADGGVLVENDRVVAVGPAGELRRADPHARERAWPGVLTPGLVNAHTHLQFTDFADLATSRLPFTPWIRTLTERAGRTTPEEWAAGARRGVHALLASGTTAAGDVVTHPPALAPVARAGLAGVSFLEVVGVDGPRWPNERQTYLRELAGAPAGRAVGVAPHALYTLGSGVVRDLVSIARDRGLRLHVHAAETSEECEFVAAGAGAFADVMRGEYAFELLTEACGRTPVAELAALGCLGPDTHVAHGVHVDAADRAVLRTHATAVALCVRSNAILGAGTPPVAAYLAEGNPLAVGTDSAASSPDLDLVAELHALRGVARAQGYDDGDLDERLVRAATEGGAAALGCPDGGRLVPGARADLAVFDVPTDGDPYRALVDGGGGRCIATVLAGRLVHRRDRVAS